MSGTLRARKQWIVTIGISCLFALLLCYKLRFDWVFRQSTLYWIESGSPWFVLIVKLFFIHTDIRMMRVISVYYTFKRALYLNALLGRNIEGWFEKVVQKCKLLEINHYYFSLYPPIDLISKICSIFSNNGIRPFSQNRQTFLLSRQTFCL